MSNPATILLVDDNATNLKLAADVLECAGFAVRRAGNAQEALSSLDTGNPDLILMDIQMPGMDGLELTRRLKADPATHSIPIIALTSFAMKGDEEKAFAAGCNGYITKPINTRQLPLQVADMLRGSHAAPIPPPT